MNADGCDDGSPGPFELDADDCDEVECTEVEPEAVTTVVFTAVKEDSDGDGKPDPAVAAD